MDIFSRKVRYPAVTSLIVLINIGIGLFSIAGARPGQALPKVDHSVKPFVLSKPSMTKDLMAAGQLGGQIYAKVIPLPSVMMSWGLKT